MCRRRIIYICTYSVTPTTVTTGWSATTRNFTVTTQTGCGWSAASSKPMAYHSIHRYGKRDREFLQ